MISFDSALTALVARGYIIDHEFAGDNLIREDGKQAIELPTTQHQTYFDGVLFPEENLWVGVTLDCDGNSIHIEENL